MGAVLEIESKGERVAANVIFCNGQMIFVFRSCRRITGMGDWH
jgi:hypothetical protein